MLNMSLIKRGSKKSISLILVISNCLFVLSGIFSAVSIPVNAQTSADGSVEELASVPGYRQANLVSDVPGIALVQDSLLVNPWGITLTASSPFWVANNGQSTSTLYRELPGSDLVTINPGTSSITIPGGLPTGTVANATNDFVISAASGSARSLFLFSSITGNITGWNPAVQPSPAPNPTTAIIASAQPGHVYTGLAIGSTGPNNFLYAADFANGKIDVFDKNFVLQPPGTFPFNDPTIPMTPGNTYHPFNIQNLGGILFVAYAKVGLDGRDEAGPGNGFVSKFNTDGTFIGRLISNGALNSPWGLVIAPATFGTFSNALLVGNFGEGNPGDGSINAFNPTTGALLGTLKDEGGNPIVIDELWAIIFGNGGNGGDTNALYFAAGIAEEEHGLFGSLRFNPTAPTSLIQFSSTDYVVGENSGQTSITVIRSGDVSGTATVNYAALPESQPAHASLANVFREGTPLGPEIPTPIPNPFPDQSYERKPGGAAGSTQDTGNNAADFQILTPSNPQNLSSALTPAAGTAPTSSGVVISEFRTVGPGVSPNNSDQFVELYNNTNAPVDISGWKIKSQFGALPITTHVTVNPSTIIPARGHFLATRPGYTGSVPGNQTFTQLIIPGGGIAVTRADDTIVDQVGFTFGDFVLSPGTLTFAPGETSKTFQVAVLPDPVVEGDEVVKLVLSNPVGSALTQPNIATLTITDNAGAATPGPVLSISDVSVVEGNAGTTNAVFTVSLTPASALTTTVNFATANGTATAPSDFNATSGVLNFAPNETSKTITVQINGDVTPEPNEVFFVNLSSPANATISDIQGTGTIIDDDSPIVQFGAATFTVAENAGKITINVTRTGSNLIAGTVSFATSDSFGLANCNTVNGSASDRCDYNTTIGLLRFGAGEISKSFDIFITDDAHIEGSESFTITLSGPLNQGLGAISTATVTITDNDSSAAPNPIDAIPFFVRQQYIDFLAREPDSVGFQNWVNTLTPCPNGGFGINNPQCDRVRVASSFFPSLEFGERGYLVYRFYDGTLGRRPQYREFMRDLQFIGGSQSPAQSEASKVALFQGYVESVEFQAIYAGLTDAAHATQFVARLELTSGVTLPEPSRSQLISDMQSGSKTADQVLRAFVESPVVFNRFFNRGFVSMLYFGFLRRDPDTIGFTNWLNQIDLTGDSRPIVFGFIYSPEYRGRFGQP